MDEKDLCAKCWAEISPNALFCSSCGQVHINNQIIPTKTTAEYDPGNKQRKPWREPVPTANNSWKDKNIKDNIPNYIPWKPVMNQSKVYVKRVKGKPSRLPLPEDCLDNSGSPAASKETESARRQFERLNSKRVLLFRGRLWSKSGNSYRKKKTIFNPDMIYGYEPKLDRYEDDQSSKESIAPVSFFPLGIYSVDWVCDQERSMCIHITLLRRSFRSKYNHNLSTFWLRIGCEIENPSIGEDNDGADQGREFCVLDYLPNCLAKCMGATMQGGWVDLKYVRHNYHFIHLIVLLD